MTLAIAVLVFCAVSAASLLVLYRVDRQQRLKERLKIASAQNLVAVSEELEENVTPPLGQRLLRAFSKAFGIRRSQKMEIELQKADIALTAAEFLALNILTSLAPLSLIVAGLRPLTAVLLAAIGAAGPQLFLRLRQRRRAAQFAAQIPDVLVMLSNSLKAGYSFFQAMSMVAEEMPPPISTEFNRILKEINLGVSTETALQNSLQRVESEDFDLVITAVIIQRQIGGNLSEILDNIAFTIRERIRIKGEIKTLTAQGRISGLVISLLPVGIAGFVFVINPEYIGSLFTHPLGQAMVVAGVLGQFLAMILIRRIVNIEV